MHQAAWTVEESEDREGFIILGKLSTVVETGKEGYRSALDFSTNKVHIPPAILSFLQNMAVFDCIATDITSSNMGITVVKSLEKFNAKEAEREQINF